MPSLKVAFVCRTNSSSGMPRNCMKSTNDGMVASPTPIVPTSSDSISTTSQSVLCRARTRQAAVTHPAVPPPTMTTRLIRFPSLTACYAEKRRLETRPPSKLLGGRVSAQTGGIRPDCQNVPLTPITKRRPEYAIKLTRSLMSSETNTRSSVRLIPSNVTAHVSVT